MDWWTFFESFEVERPRGLSPEQWEQESIWIEESVYHLDPNSSYRFQFLLRAGVYEYVGPTRVQLMGISWPNSGSKEYVPEPPGLMVKDVTKEVAELLKDQNLQYRPKRDGVCFQGDGQVMKGSFVVHAPFFQAEFVYDRFYVLDSEFKGAQIYDGWTFYSSHWSTKPVASEEGMIVRWKEEEWRWKYVPTVEVTIEYGFYQGTKVDSCPPGFSGIAEVYWSGSRVVFVKERWHKKTKDESSWRILSSLEFFRDQLGLPRAFEVPLSDSVSWATPVGDGFAIFRLPRDIDEMEMQIRSAQPFHSDLGVYKEVESSKATFLCSHGSFAVIKEPHKLLDFVGGQREPTDSDSLHTLTREWKEEMGYDLKDRATYVKTVRRVENFTLYTTHLYAIQVASFSEQELKPFCSHLSGPVVPWFNSYLIHARNYSRTHYSFRRDSDKKKVAPLVVSQSTFVPRYGVSRGTYQLFSELLNAHPGLAYSERIYTTTYVTLPFVRVGRDLQKKNHCYIELQWSALDYRLKCAWIASHRELIKGTALPFGMRKKDFNKWEQEFKGKCPICLQNVTADPCSC